jgi:hypothetical protein
LIQAWRVTLEPQAVSGWRTREDASGSDRRGLTAFLRHDRDPGLAQELGYRELVDVAAAVHGRAVGILDVV